MAEDAADLMAAEEAATRFAGVALRLSSRG
jgi:hypothetical protein